MPTFEVTTSLIVHCTVRVVVEAENGDAAIEAVAESMPNNFDAGSREGWRGTIDIKPPKSVKLATGIVKASYFEQASGIEKAKKISP